MDGGARADSRRGQGAQYLAGLDRWGRPSCGTSCPTRHSAPSICSRPSPLIRAAEYSRDNRWKYFGLVNEPCFSKANRPRPGALRAVARQAQRRLSPDPFAEREEVPWRCHRCARQEPSSGVLLRLPHRDRRPASVPQSRFRRGRGQEMECREVLRRIPTTTKTRI